MPLDGDASVADVKSPGLMRRASAGGTRPAPSPQPGRRSFAIYPDGVVRVRTDGTLFLIDPPLVGHK